MGIRQPQWGIPWLFQQPRFFRWWIVTSGGEIPREIPQGDLEEHPQADIVNMQLAL